MQKYIVVALFVLFVLATTTSCGSYIFAPDGVTGASEKIAADVEATVEVAVAATVAAMDMASGATVVEIEPETPAEAENGAIDDTESAAIDEQAQLMQWVSANTRHYIGDPNAPVVLIEFSDFQ